MHSNIKKVSPGLSAGGLAFVGLAVSLLSSGAWSSLVTVNQTFKYDYSYIRRCTAFDDTGACTSGLNPVTVLEQTVTNNSLSSSTRLDPAFPIEGVDQWSAKFEIDLDNDGIIKSKTVLGGFARNNEENADYTTKFNASASNQIQFEDFVTTDDPRGEIFRFQTLITGNVTALRSYAERGDVTPGLFPQNQGDPGARYVHSVNVAGLLGNDEVRNFRREFTDPGGFYDNSFRQDQGSVNLNLTFLDIIHSGSPSRFFFDFSDTISMELNNPDTDYWGAELTNDLMSTLTITASVFDINGNLLPNARVRSSQGFLYDPIAALGSGGNMGSPIPVPATALLMALGLVGAGRRRLF